MYIKKNDNVIVLSGKDKGKTGKILKVFLEQNSVMVQKINMVKKTIKKTKEQAGGIIEIEKMINVSKVMLLCEKCTKPTRIKNEKLSDNKKVRVCKKCGEILI